MPVDDVVTGATTEGIPVAPSMGAALEVARVPPERALVDGRVWVVVVPVLGGVVVGLMARYGSAAIRGSPAPRDRRPHRGAGGNGRHVRGGLPRAARLGDLRLRDHATAAGPLAAARRLQ